MIVSIQYLFLAVVCAVGWSVFVAFPDHTHFFQSSGHIYVIHELALDIHETPFRRQTLAKYPNKKI